MLNNTFYHDTIRRYVVYFGTVFNDIYINRVVDGETTQTIKVPLSYGPKEPMLARLDADPNLDRPTALTLPRIGFEIKSFRYDKERHLLAVNKRAATTDAKNKLKYTFQPVPYNIEFELSVMTKSAQDGTRIIEQILPYFKPEWTATVIVLPEMNISHDIPIVLNDISIQDTYAINFKERRAIIWTLKFTMKAYLYGPVKESKIINKAIIDLFAPSGDLEDAINYATPVENITVTPGLTANGEPTSNSALSVPLSEIDADDNYGYIVDFESFL